MRYRAWLRDHHPGLLNDSTEIIAAFGPFPLVVAGAVFGTLLAFLMPLPHPPLQDS